jgi:uncharacterized protein (TIGR02284 family)
MATMVGTQKDISKLLVQLIELDYDAIAAYRASIERLDDTVIADQFESFAADHDRHVRDLSTILEGMGEVAPSGPDVKQVLTKGKVVIAGLAGDRAILMAMKTNEDDTNTAYERASKRDDMPQHLIQIFTRNLADERRHRSWIEQQLGTEATATARR